MRNKVEKRGLESLSGDLPFLSVSAKKPYTSQGLHYLLNELGVLDQEIHSFPLVGPLQHQKHWTGLCLAVN